MSTGGEDEPGTILSRPRFFKFVMWEEAKILGQLDRDRAFYKDFTMALDRQLHDLTVLNDALQYNLFMHPGSIVRAIADNRMFSTSILRETSWELALVVACSRSRYSCTPWVSEKTGERSNVWPTEVSWRCTVLFDNRVLEWILDDADFGMSWSVV